MPKARIPSVPIQFGLEEITEDAPKRLQKRARLLIYDYNALAELQDIAGTYQSNVAAMKSLRAVLWAGMLAETLDDRGRETEQTLSLVEVGEILMQMDKPEVDALVKAVKQARGAAEPEENPTMASEKP